MRRFIDIVENQTTDLSSTLWTLGDWLNGDAMSLINDDGQRFSPKPYYEAMKEMAAVVPPTRLKALSGLIYRGVGFDDIEEFKTGKAKTAMKKMQSWSPDLEIAKEFSRDYGGRYGVIFSADVQKNRKAIILSVADVLAWLRTDPPEVQARDMADIRYQFERYEHQDEIIVKGSSVHIDSAKVIRKPRAKKSS